AEPEPLIVADSRSGLGRFPPVRFKMNQSELAREMGQSVEAKASIGKVSRWAAEIAHRNGHSVFVTLADEGILVVGPEGSVEACAPVPSRGEIDITGAGDAVTANLATALACGAVPSEACQIAMAAASVVVEQLGTTGRADVAQIAGRLPDTESG
ncbi:MAG: PfkB family carbohydrate kinase, partial [Mariniblastus sp.]|nr:PfkB family carbohydrate kinase [Mariniblastus sp.]